ncbi:addiction module protein [Longimicrobium sp.]|uniref:addiction module protein n=1 Tax=Longimicrobium sp. TaxID=2029185 RepID=UPI002E341D28|nr:addiction module protein [Longimicrobium sp.]HEX6042310.1 addiction module protein [Longimicrobium sp.]
MSIDEIEAVALELPEQERAELIGRLQDSITDDGLDQAWRAEVRRRVARIEAGDVEWIDGEEVLAELRADP